MLATNILSIGFPQLFGCGAGRWLFWRGGQGQKVGGPWFEFQFEFVDKGQREESKVFFVKGKSLETVEKLKEWISLKIKAKKCSSLPSLASDGIAGGVLVPPASLGWYFRLRLPTYFLITKQNFRTICASLGALEHEQELHIQNRVQNTPKKKYHFPLIFHPQRKWVKQLVSFQVWQVTKGFRIAGKALNRQTNFF